MLSFKWPWAHEWARWREPDKESGRVSSNAGHGMGISKNPAFVWGNGAAPAPQLGWFQELSSTRVLFLSAVCWRLGRLWRVRIMCSGVTGLLFQRERGWMCGTVLAVGISFMSAARSLWVLVCGIQRGVETEAWPFNKIPNLFIFFLARTLCCHASCYGSFCKTEILRYIFLHFNLHDRQLALEASCTVRQCFCWWLSEVLMRLSVHVPHKYLHKALFVFLKKS